MSLTRIIEAFRAEAAAALGGEPCVQLVSPGWTRRLPEVLDHAALPFAGVRWPGAPVRLVTYQRDDHSNGDWTGLIELWPDSDEPVLADRIHTLNSSGEVVALFAARTEARVRKAAQACYEAWRRWRRVIAPIRDTDEGELHVPKVRWDELCLPERLLAELRGSIEGFAAGRSLYDRLGMPYRRGILLYGPPGNGKSMICRAIVTSLGWPTVAFTPSDGYRDMLRIAFDLVAQLTPAVLLFEDVDSVFRDRQGLSGFLNRLDGLEPQDGVLVIATTNHPDKLDLALTSRPSRFDLVFEIPDPARAERERYLARLFGPHLDPATIASLVDPTQGMSIAFLKELFLSSCTRAFVRGAERPSAEDTRLALEQLARHHKAAKREFEAERATGFGT